MPTIAVPLLVAKLMPTTPTTPPTRLAVIVATRPFSVTLKAGELKPTMLSLSKMFSAATDCAPSVAPPVGLNRINELVRVPSLMLLSKTETVKD